MSKKIKTLAIETSCDDTSVAIISFENWYFQVEKILSYTQSIHQKYGWVVPELASREHSFQILELLKNFEKDLENVDFFSVTSFPGLPWSLMVWTTTANFLSSKYKKPLINVNHINWHIFSGILERNMFDFSFPQIILSVSWGHNDIYLLKLLKDWKQVEKFEYGSNFRDENRDLKSASIKNQIEQYNFDIQKIWQTLDDAAGECFDKVSRMLGWPYPWGKFIWDLAKTSDFDENIKFKRVYLDSQDYNFSFSGFKSQVQNYISKLTKNWKNSENLTDKIRGSIAKEFEQAVVEILTKKTILAANQHDAKMIGLVGWVSANTHLRAEFENLTFQISQANENKTFSIENFFSPKNKKEKFIFKNNFSPNFYTTTNILYSTDNGAMIGVAGILEYLKLI